MTRSFWKTFFWCKHENVRCLHGDEVLGTLRIFHKPWIARVRCLDCGRALYGEPLPEICYFSKQVHPSRREGNDRF